jgi:phosphoglycerol transferase
MKMCTSNIVGAVTTALMLACLISCSGKPAETIAEINFANAELPDAVAEISGFSDRESWGRWSDANIAPTAKIRFKHPLPQQFSITLTGQSIPSNETSVIKIGKFEEQFYLQKLSDIATIDVKLDRPEDTIEIIPPDPASPKKLGLNEDPRKLGVGIATLLIEK